MQVNTADAASRLAETLVGQQRAGEAVLLLEGVLARQPDDVQTLCSLGLALAALQQWQRCLACLERAAALRPHDAAVLNNLGNALQQAGQAEAALQAFRRAVAAQPGLAILHANLAGTLLALGRVDEALPCYAQRLAIEPGHAAAYSDLLLAMHYSERIGPEQLATAHRRFAEQIEQPLLPARRPHANTRDAGRRLRVGIVSSDLRLHSVAFFIEPVLEHHEASQFELFAYFNHTGGDAVTARLRPHFQRWHAIAQLSDSAVEQLIGNDGIDILIDLNGHTGDNRLALFARKPAPLQLSWLGYPNTTGLQGIDHRITDSRADPPGQTEAWHSETLWRLPGCFLCYRPPAVAPAPAVRTVQQPVVFGSLNNPAKIGPGVVAAWSRILAATPGSRLVLKLRGGADASIRESLLQAFARHGVTAGRLILLERLDAMAHHLQRYDMMDIALDTFPYAGTTTTCDALWMGVPVISFAGRSHAARVGASLLHAAGLETLVTDSVDAYVDAAVQLAHDAPRLQQLRAGLRERIAASKLTDAAAFTRDFEAALRQMWARWCMAAG